MSEWIVTRDVQSIDVRDVPCRLVIPSAPRAEPWQEARHACEAALAQGFAFVMILDGAATPADDSLLSDEDRQRAARYRQARDRHNFVLGRMMLHHLVRPRGLPVPSAITHGPHGKPFLAGAPACNLSHSGPWVACAVSPREPIGIDVETFDRLADHRDLLPVITHPAERGCIERAPADNRLALFKRCWTRKEAVLKATGTGLSDNLQAIDVCLDEEEPVLVHPAPLRLIHLPMDEAQATASLALDPAICGVVVMHGDGSDRQERSCEPHGIAGGIGSRHA